MATARLSSDTVKKLAHAIHTALSQGSAAAEEFAERVVASFEGREVAATEEAVAEIEGEGEAGEE